MGILQSFSCAIAGIFYALIMERNMKLHFLAAVGVIFWGSYLQISRMEWGLIAFAVSLVIITEIINTAIEKTIDLITDQYHPLAKVAKNLAAGAVLVSALNAIVVAVLVFGTRLG